MTPDQLTIAFLFTFLLGGYIGRALTLDQQARKTVECMTALINSEWWGPAAKVAELHRDQDALPEVGPLILSQTTYSRLLHASVRAK